MVARRRAHRDEYAGRVNRAVVLLGEVSPAEAVCVLQAEHGVSERQARRYVSAAREAPGGVPVPERTVVFTVRLPRSLVARLRAVAHAGGQSLSATATRALEAGLERAPARSRGGSAR